MFSPDAVANEFLDISKEQGEKINCHKLVYLIYLSHGWHLCLYDSPLINHPICAGKSGIIITSIFDKLVTQFGSDPVTCMCSNIDFDDDGKLMIFFPRLTDECDSEEKIGIAKDLIKHCAKIYKDWTGIQLSDYCRQKGSPYRVIYEVMMGNVPSGIWIPNNVIKKYFSKLMNENLKKSISDTAIEDISTFEAMNI